MANPATAATCQNWHNKQICFLQIKRSAKYYWEYRATVAIDGVKQTPTIYNCRTRSKTIDKGRSSSFSNNGVGELICRKFAQK